MKKILALVLCIAMAVTVLACTPADGGETTPTPPPASGTPDGGDATPPPAEGPQAIAKEDLKIGLIYVGDASDGGYNFAHDKGRAYMQEQLGLTNEQIIIKENITEDNACAEAITELLAQGCNVIFGNSFGFQTYMAEAAAANPSVYFCHATGQMDNGVNMCRYFGRIYQPRYLAGIAAGLKTTSNKIGYVGAFKNAEVNCGLNAFALGVQSVNPEAQVYVKYTQNWYDPAGETAAAEALLDMGCDIIAQHVDTTGPQVAAQNRGVFGVGYNNDMTEFAPDAHLCAPIWNWGGIMTTLVQSIIDGTFKGELTFGDMADGTVDLSPLTKNVAEGTQAKIDEVKQKILAGTWDVFTGEIYDNKGNLIPESTFTDEYIYAGMSEMLVKGVNEA